MRNALTKGGKSTILFVAALAQGAKESRVAFSVAMRFSDDTLQM